MESLGPSEKWAFYWLWKKSYCWPYQSLKKIYYKPIQVDNQKQLNRLNHVLPKLTGIMWKQIGDYRAIRERATLLVVKKSPWIFSLQTQQFIENPYRLAVRRNIWPAIRRENCLSGMLYILYNCGTNSQIFKYIQIYLDKHIHLSQYLLIYSRQNILGYSFVMYLYYQIYLVVKNTYCWLFHSPNKSVYKPIQAGSQKN